MDYKGVIVGLGNPGAKYDHTRHNCGFDFVSYLVELAARDGEASQQNGGKFSCELWRLRLPKLGGQTADIHEPERPVRAAAARLAQTQAA